jgi:nicotinamidase-related amidase
MSVIASDIISPSTSHGMSEKSCTCLLIIDMINEFTFPGSENMFPEVIAVAEQIANCKRRTKAAGLPTIYVNDNFGQWRSDLPHLVEKCRATDCKGRAIVECLAPEKDDYVILKPRHSGFFGTPLELLLMSIHTRRLIITGIATDSCVLYTAADAYMRNYELMVPSDCVAAINSQAHHNALAHIETMLKANTSRSSELNFSSKM